MAEVIAGQSPKSEFYNNKKEGLPFYQGKKDFGTHTLKPSEVYTSEITKESLKNDILMSVRAPVGDVNLNPYEKICIGRGLCAIRAQNYKFLFLCIHHNKHLFMGNKGLTFKSISTPELRNTKIPLPPKRAQEQIASVIEHLEQEMRTLKTQIIALESQKQEVLEKHLLNANTCS